MAITRDQYLQQAEGQYLPMLELERARKLQALKQVKESTLGEYQTGIGEVNQERDRVTPTFQTQRNQVDANAAQNVQRMREMMAARGLYRSGTAVSEEANAMNQRSSLLANVDTQQNQFNSGMANKIAELERVKAQRLAGYGDEERLANEDYAGKVTQYRNKALSDYEDYVNKLQQGASGGGGSQPKDSDIVRQNTALAYQQINDLLHAGYTLSGARDQLRQWIPSLVEGGVNAKTLEDYLDGIYQQQMSSGFRVGSY